MRAVFIRGGKRERERDKGTKNKTRVSGVGVEEQTGAWEKEVGYACC